MDERKRYFLVTDATAAEVEKLTGMRGHDTPLGALVENTEPLPPPRKIIPSWARSDLLLVPQKLINTVTVC